MNPLNLAHLIQRRILMVVRMAIQTTGTKFKSQRKPSVMLKRTRSKSLEVILEMVTRDSILKMEKDLTLMTQNKQITVTLLRIVRRRQIHGNHRLATRILQRRQLK